MKTGPQLSHVVLEIQNVSMAYSSGKPVLQSVSLSVRQGEFVSLIGASGCGKSTLLNLVAGFFPPIGGDILLNGTPVASPGSDRCMVFQEDAVFPWYTVEQNIAYPLRLKRINANSRQTAVRNLVRIVGLEGWEGAFPRQLSGGMRKRVDLARALAAEPSVLLMDEPFAALDAITKVRLQTEFLQLWDANRMTVLFVTHDIEEALFVSDRVIVMMPNPGRLERELDVPFARPRPASLRTAPEFQAIRHQLIEALHIENGS